MEKVTLNDYLKSAECYSKDTTAEDNSNIIEIKLPKNLNAVKLAVIHNLNIGELSFSPAEIKNLLSHIEEIKNDEEARVVLGGDLFNFASGGKEARMLCAYPVDKQVEVLTDILEPIKDKIVVAYDGTSEQNFIKKDAINPTSMLIDNLGINPKTYTGTNFANASIEFQNDYTKGTKQKVNMLLDHGFLTANTYTTALKKTRNLENLFSGKDLYVSTHYNKFSVVNSSRVFTTKKGAIEKKPVYFVTLSGYREYYDQKNKDRHLSPAYTGNSMLRVFVAENPEHKATRPKNTIGEPKYKTNLEIVHFGRNVQDDFNFELIDHINDIKNKNRKLTDSVIYAIQDKVNNRTKEDIKTAIQEFYPTETNTEMDTINEVSDNTLIDNDSSDFISE